MLGIVSPDTIGEDQDAEAILGTEGGAAKAGDQHTYHEFIELVFHHPSRAFEDVLSELSHQPRCLHTAMHSVGFAPKTKLRGNHLLDCELKYVVEVLDQPRGIAYLPGKTLGACVVPRDRSSVVLPHLTMAKRHECADVLV